MSFVAAGFWFLLGFMVASVMSYKAQQRKARRHAAAFQAAKDEVLRIIQSAAELTEVRVTIRDETGELQVETDEGLPPPPRKNWH